MEINSENALNILNINYNYEISNTILGKAIKMPAYDAFLYSNVTGAGYFDNSIMPFTPKGLMKIFYNAFNYNFVTGIFDNGFLKYTPYNLCATRPYLFSGEKYIIFVEFDSEEELRKKLKDMLSVCRLNNIPSTNFIIHRIEKSKKGNGMESFLEYLACESFKDNGYIVENQIPLAATVGSPDFGGYSISELNEMDSIVKIVGNGFHIIELSMIRLCKKNVVNNTKTSNKNIVGEAKTSTCIMEKQLRKYLNTGLFEAGFEIHPTKEMPDKADLGLINIDNYYVKIQYPKEIVKYSNTYSIDEYEKWLLNYMKFYLISNFTNDELKKYYTEKTHRNAYNINDLVAFISNLSINEIVLKIMEV